MDLLNLPQELLSNVLSFLNPQAIIQFGRTCKTAHGLIKPENHILWKSAFLHIFDDPNDAWSMMPQAAQCSANNDWGWHRELTKRLWALRDIQSRWCGANPRAEDDIDALLGILDTAKFAPTPRDIANGKLPKEDDRNTSFNLQILSSLGQSRDGLESLIHDLASYRFLRSSASESNPGNSLTRPITRSITMGENEKHRPQSVARLHVLYGLTGREQIENKAFGAARRKVYDWSRIGLDNDYGPFNRDGSGLVDWSLLEGVYSVIARNFVMCVDGRIAIPQGFCYSIPHRTLIDPTTPADWARVTGSWLGTYSFLDYADLFAFNTWDDHLGARPSLDDETEDYGDLMRLDLRLDSTICNDPRLKTSLPTSTDLPVLFFSGISQGQARRHGPAIGVRGCASLLPGGREVRWRFIIHYGGHDQWQLEGVQPGGIRSGGVFGLWTQCEHEENGPVGPFCYFPMELCKPTSVVLVA